VHRVVVRKRWPTVRASMISSDYWYGIKIGNPTKVSRKQGWSLKFTLI
jgi:hypothetical protein